MTFQEAVDRGVIRAKDQHKPQVVVYVGGPGYQVFQSDAFLRATLKTGHIGRLDAHVEPWGEVTICKDMVVAK